MNEITLVPSEKLIEAKRLLVSVEGHLEHHRKMEARPELTARDLRNLIYTEEKALRDQVMAFVDDIANNKEKAT